MAAAIAIPAPIAQYLAIVFKRGLEYLTGDCNFQFWD
jgi:hypothetical protein